MAAAGYVSFGPFPFGTNHTTDEIEKLLPGEPLLWIETAHFRIGCALPATTVTGNKAWLPKLTAELRRLAARLPDVRPDSTHLDPWLRAHLVAQRAEDTWAEVLADLGRTDADFPPVPGHEPRDAQRFLGLGPYLGMPQKFTILLLRKATNLANYTAAHHGWATKEPTRYYDHRFGCVFFGAAEESSHGVLRHDEALHTHLAFHVAHNLYTSYRSYGHNLPAWLITGLAHRHARHVSTRFPIYDLRAGPGSDPDLYPRWEKRWQGMLKDRAFAPLPDFVERLDVDTFTMADHLQCWALVDWLMTTRGASTMAFLHRMKDPFHERLRFPTDAELLARQRHDMQQAFGVDAAGLEELWRKEAGTRVASGRPVASRRR